MHLWLRSCRTLLGVLQPPLCLVGDLAFVLQLQNSSSLGSKLWFEFGDGFQEKVQQYAAWKNESPEYWLVFLLSSLHWVRLVLSCHKHLISFVDCDWKNTINLSSCFPFWVEPVTHSSWIFASSFTVMQWTHLRLAQCLSDKICWQVTCQQKAVGFY